MKVGDLVTLTKTGEHNLDNIELSEGDKAILLSIYEGDEPSNRTNHGDLFYKIVMCKNNRIIEHLWSFEIKKFE